MKDDPAPAPKSLHLQKMIRYTATLFVQVRTPKRGNIWFRGEFNTSFYRLPHNLFSHSGHCAAPRRSCWVWCLFQPKTSMRRWRKRGSRNKRRNSSRRDWWGSAPFYASSNCFQLMFMSHGLFHPPGCSGVHEEEAGVWEEPFCGHH